MPTNIASGHGKGQLYGTSPGKTLDVVVDLVDDLFGNARLMGVLATTIW
jgi:hypothetical protein